MPSTKDNVENTYFGSTTTRSIEPQTIQFPNIKYSTYTFRSRFLIFDVYLEHWWLITAQEMSQSDHNRYKIPDEMLKKRNNIFVSKCEIHTLKDLIQIADVTKVRHVNIHNVIIMVHVMFRSSKSIIDSWPVKLNGGENFNHCHSVGSTTQRTGLGWHTFTGWDQTY